MVNVNNLDISKLSVTIRLVVEECIKRGWNVELAYPTSALAFINRGDGKIIRIFSSTPPTLSYAAGYLANDKYATHTLLESGNFPVLPTVLVPYGADIAKAAGLLSHGSLVVKPLDAGHGKGITTNIETTDALKAALEFAAEHGKNTQAAVVQKMYFNPIDVRVLCIDGRVAASILRAPARVKGDGVRTVREIIAQENAEIRGIPYESQLAFIDEERAQTFLGEKIDTVPAADEYVQVLGTANYGSGGEAIDVTDTVPDWLAEIACQIAGSMQLPVCGVDFMLKQTPEKHHTLQDLEPAVTEVNKCPSFGLHHTPTSGAPRDVTALYVDYLATL